MNWITNYVRPTINSLFSRREIPDNLWSKCPECGTMLFHRELSDNLNVCTNCDHHLAITPRDRFGALFDGGVFSEVKVPEPIADPLHFRDQKKYPDRMKAAQKATGEKEAMLVAEGEMNRTPIVAAAQNFAFMGGSMSMYVGNAIIAGAERAVKLKRPFVLFSAAGGARMQEGILAPHADAAHHDRGRDAEGCGPALHRGPDPSDDGRRHRLLRDAGRCASGRTQCADRLCGRAGDRTDDPGKAARRLPAVGIPSRSWDARPGDPSQGDEG